ncbi:MAG: toll/interleukin-1 receptor domain-containing protein [Chloroflexi bacterium]|nr:toll/interleukin-1 receptor domain-containing protein [Chloroflexota bacterium]MCC6892717.1 toll/interleukin-1 receptor domain-containing protein [Anaerolineae bacterium]
MSQVFISYQHNAYTFVVDDLVKRVEKEGFTAWWDDHIRAGHDDWRQKIDTEIEKAAVMLVVVTPDAVASQYVTYEWSYALGKNKIVIPLTYQTAPVHPRLNTHQALNFTDARTREWNELTIALHDYLDHPTEQVAPLNNLISKDALLDALADLLCTKRIVQTDLNTFLNQSLISPLDIAEVRRRSLKTTSLPPG